jgi:hypothetical protein
MRAIELNRKALESDPGSIEAPCPDWRTGLSLADQIRNKQPQPSSHAAPSPSARNYG